MDDNNKKTTDNLMAKEIVVTEKGVSGITNEIEKEVTGVVKEVEKEILEIEHELEQEVKTEEQQQAMEKMYDKTFTELSAGTIIEGEVVRVDHEGVFVSIGLKMDGIIPMDQLSHRGFSSPDEIVKVGEKISVYIIDIDDDEGKFILSKKRADLEDAWRRVTTAYEEQTVLTATAIEQVKGGLIVDLGVRGFVPASQIRLRPVRNLDDFVGEPLRLKVIDLDRSRRKVVLSQKKVLMEEKTSIKETTLNNLQERQIVKGTVARVTDFGAFINLGGVDGLVHISELSRSRVEHPSQVLKVGDEVEVMVLAINKKKEKISLSIKQTQPDPWLNNIQDYHEDDIHEGKITKIAKNYVFVQLSPGLEGLVPIHELSDDKNIKIEELFNIGDNVSVKILDIKPSQRRMTLSIKQAKEEKVSKEYNASQNRQSNDSVTLGDYLAMNKSEAN